jgi:SRSO17 transposase
MITRALDAGTPTGWVTGDEVYGADPQLRAGIEERQVSYVLAVAKSHPVATAADVVRADALAAKLPPRAWQRPSAGAGAKGHRWYDWAWVAIDPGVPGHRHLLIRRCRRTRELAYYRCYSPRHVPLALLVAAAGRRWMVEEDFQATKGLAAPLNEHQVRRWTSWYRWVTLAMLALAFLTVAALAEHASKPASSPSSTARSRASLPSGQATSTSATSLTCYSSHHARSGWESAALSSGPLSRTRPHHGCLSPRTSRTRP